MANAYTVRTPTLNIQDSVASGKALPMNIGGRLRLFRESYTIPTGGIAADTVVGAIKLPPGPIGILARNSHLQWSATTSGATMDVGYADYRDAKTAEVNTDGIVDALADGVDINSSTAPVWLGLQSNGDDDYFAFDTNDGLVITLKPIGATLPEGLIVEVNIVAVTA